LLFEKRWEEWEKWQEKRQEPQMTQIVRTRQPLTANG